MLNNLPGSHNVFSGDSDTFMNHVAEQVGAFSHAADRVGGRMPRLPETSRSDYVEHLLGGFGSYAYRIGHLGSCRVISVLLLDHRRLITLPCLRLSPRNTGRRYNQYAEGNGCYEAHVHSPWRTLVYRSRASHERALDSRV